MRTYARDQFAITLDTTKNTVQSIQQSLYNQIEKNKLFPSNLNTLNGTNVIERAGTIDYASYTYYSSVEIKSTSKFAVNYNFTFNATNAVVLEGPTNPTKCNSVITNTTTNMTSITCTCNLVPKKVTDPANPPV